MQEKPAVFIYGKVRQPPELMHYGIKGQKWGVRRFQYENGSYTTEGKERYGRGSKKENTGGRHRKAVADLDSIIDSKDPKVRSVYSDKDRKDLINYRNKLAKKDNMPLRTSGIKARGNKDPNARENWKAKDVSKLSDEELRRRNNRLQAEQQYKSATTPEWKKEAKQIAKDSFKRIFVATAVTAMTAIVAKNYKDIIGPFISSKVSKPISTIVATNMLRKEINRKNHFDNRGPEILGKHVGQR